MVRFGKGFVCGACGSQVRVAEGANCTALTALNLTMRSMKAAYLEVVSIGRRSIPIRVSRHETD